MILKVIFLILFLLFSAVITFQDLKDRLISAWAILVYWLTCIGGVVLLRSASELYTNAISTTVYFGLCFLCITGYYFIKESRFINIVDSKIGLGDILLLPAISLTLSVIPMILFFASGFCLAAFAGIFLGRNNKTIPLAGIMVSWHIVYLTVLELFPGLFLL